MLYTTKRNHTMKGVVLCSNEMQWKVKHYMALKVKHFSVCIIDASFQDRK